MLRRQSGNTNRNIKRFLSDEGPMLETLDHTIRIGSTPTFLYFDLYIYILTLKVKRGLLIYRGQQCF